MGRERFWGLKIFKGAVLFTCQQGYHPFQKIYFISHQIYKWKIKIAFSILLDIVIHLDHSNWFDCTVNLDTVTQVLTSMTIESLICLNYPYPGRTTLQWSLSPLFYTARVPLSPPNLNSLLLINLKIFIFIFVLCHPKVFFFTLTNIYWFRTITCMVQAAVRKDGI